MNERALPASASAPGTSAGPSAVAALPAFAVSRALFVRGLGVIHFIAFASLAVQIRGLAGSAGILPAGRYLDAAHDALGVRAFHLLPTVFWLSSGDATLVAATLSGALLACVLVSGFAPKPVLFALWVLYLSLVTAGQVFLQFQWDALLLETTLVAIVVSPAGLRPHWREDEPLAITRLPVWWLCFRLMFLSGITKLLSGDPTWRHLTALDYHYWTQPLPNPVAWYAAKLPRFMQKASAALMFAIEVGAPLLILAPTRLVRLRRIACAVLIALQFGIAITGNYGFFNLLAILLCLALLDDRALRALDVRRVPGRIRARTAGASRTDRTTRVAAASTASPAAAAPDAGVPPVSADRVDFGQASTPMTRTTRVREKIAVTTASIMIVLGGLAFVREVVATAGVAPPAVIDAVMAPVAPFASFNGYGLFRVMTTERPEIIIESSDDGESWRPIEFRYKPGDPTRGLPVVAPHMPRVDWQMWFAALDPGRAQQWLLPFLARILAGSPSVHGLLGAASMPESSPPRFVRLMLYHYRFASVAEHRESNALWVRTLDGPLTRPLSLDELRPFLR